METWIVRTNLLNSLLPHLKDITMSTIRSKTGLKTHLGRNRILMWRTSNISDTCDIVPDALPSYPQILQRIQGLPPSVLIPLLQLCTMHRDDMSWMIVRRVGMRSDGDVQCSLPAKCTDNLNPWIRWGAWIPSYRTGIHFILPRKLKQPRRLVGIGSSAAATTTIISWLLLPWVQLLWLPWVIITTTAGRTERVKLGQLGIGGEIVWRIRRTRWNTVSSGSSVEIRVWRAYRSHWRADHWTIIRSTARYTACESGICIRRRRGRIRINTCSSSKGRSWIRRAHRSRLTIWRELSNRWLCWRELGIVIIVGLTPRLLLILVCICLRDIRKAIARMSRIRVKRVIQR